MITSSDVGDTRGPQGGAGRAEGEAAPRPGVDETSAVAALWVIAQPAPSPPRAPGSGAENNISRTAFEALAAVLGGTQSLHTGPLCTTVERGPRVATARGRAPAQPGQH